MKSLDKVKKKFLELFPTEKNVRERRFEKAGYKCEMCGGVKLLQMHHLIEGKLRRKFFERLFSVRIVCDNCHLWGKKADTITHYRKELALELLQWFSKEDVRTIIGKEDLFKEVTE